MSEWSEWIWHDGNGCPVPRGTWVISEQRSGLAEEHRALCVDYVSPQHRTCWDWDGIDSDIVRYRVKKPRGLTILENLIADLPAPVAPKVDA